MLRKKPPPKDPTSLSLGVDTSDADVDEWEDDYEDDELDEEEAETLHAAEVILQKKNAELELLWAESARVPLEDIPIEQELLGRSAMQKIIKLGQRCVRKGALQKKLVYYCGLKNIVPALKMIKRVPTRWNTMYNVVDRALALRKALDAITKLPEYRTGRPTQRLNRFFLEKEEWDILAALLPILKVRFVL